MKKNLMNVGMGGLILILVLLIGPAGAQAYTYTDLGSGGTQSLDDVWNIIPTNKGNTVDSHSSLISGFFIDRIFGMVAEAKTDQDSNTIFADGFGAGTVSFVNFHTTAPITLGGVNLFASYDKPDAGRAMSHFSLKYSTDNGTSWKNLIDNFVTKDNSLDRYTIDGETYRAMAAQFTFDPVTASYFRAEFTQYLNGSGVRVNELDAIGTVAPVPVPGTFLLLGGGLLLLAWRRQRQ